MTSMTSDATISEWSHIVNSTSALAEVLGLSPCEALHSAFPAIVGDDNAMSALAALLDPLAGTAEMFVRSGVVSADDATVYVHNVFHLLQIAAGLGHMLGVADAIGEAPEIPSDLSAVDWASLPDTFGDDVEQD
jgi:hypothetical protein